MWNLLRKIRSAGGVGGTNSEPPPLRPLPMDYPCMSRLFYFQRMLALVREVPGDIIECGVGTGNTLQGLLALALVEGKLRKIWGFDSFEGFPEVSPQDASPRAPRKGEWSDTSVERVLKKLKAAGFDPHAIDSQVTLIKGFFEESVSKYRGGPIALLHLDVDLYQSYKTCLKAFYDRVSLGGVVMFDEYMAATENLKWPGAAKAIDEFLPLGQIQRDALTGKFFHVKK